MWKALVLFFAGLLLASTAAARQRPLEFRVGDPARGAVESVRTEVADIAVVDGRATEGPRRLAQTRTYSPDGKRTETFVYDQQGAMRGHMVHFYDDRGDLVEFASFSALGTPFKREVYVRHGDELATYDGEGRLRQRFVQVWDEKRERIAEVRRYDGNGALLETRVNRYDAESGQSTWEVHGAGGRIASKNTSALDYNGPKRFEHRLYNPPGAAAAGEGDAALSDYKVVTTDPNGEPLRRERVRSERDPQRNLVKVVNYRWNHRSGDYEPYVVAYHVIKYRE
jgi:hypothetical protein